MQLKDSKILVIDDDPDVLIAMRLLLKSHVAEITAEKNPSNLPAKISEKKFDVIILDMNFNGLVNTGNEGIFWLNRIKELSPETDVILITAYGDIELAIRSLKEGASDFIIKPWKNDKLIESLTKIVKKRKKPGSRSAINTGETKIIGESEEIKQVFSKIEKVAPTDANILILGENGTGKDLVARAIHENSTRRNKPFVKVDVGALTSSLFESELFGYKKGAFTDAREDRKGRFEAANGGTLFLDEIGNISLRQQARLLTVLQNRKITPLGSNDSVEVDIRLICATNLKISELSDENKFRKDLIYRINTVDIIIPPLRARGTDITLLTRFFLDFYSDKYSKAAFKVEKSFLDKLKKHSFPGNVRELQYVVERAVIMSENSVLEDEDLSFSAIESASGKQEIDDLRLETVEKNTILKVIDKNRGNISKSAKELGITRAALYRRLDKYDL
ncbi:sigma-54-dependent transcriptional regulator [Christiangramia sediminis]|uniref:Sigma-54 dependent transcriptional regulator n=1 Tax=Christiangramia sediminis TaxID=2881336 RepID=A0A9X1RUC5_9FLAO|nr:sigma-54 dependent transcriptional regulator [Christiangramia sediminis]MCB7480528.1 sigma-54 dependent transcriptional regulator [Christiangramia sediminis]